MDKRYTLSDEDIELLADSAAATMNRWEILIGSADESLYAAVKDIFSEDERVHIDVADNGCDVLVSCAMDVPHLVIVDDELPDIRSIEVIKCLRRREEFTGINILYAVKSDEGSSDFEEYVDDYFIKKDIDTSYLSRKISSQLFASDHVPPPKRRWSRHAVDIPAKLEVRSSSHKDHCIHGTAKLANISRMGAFLTDISLEETIDANETCQVILKIDQPPLKDWSVESVFVNYKENNTSGLRFVKLTKKNHIKLLLMVDF
jgi:CheY-like chemotaxis protein